jgi:hypothetical protein
MEIPQFFSGLLDVEAENNFLNTLSVSVPNSFEYLGIHLGPFTSLANLSVVVFREKFIGAIEDVMRLLAAPLSERHIEGAQVNIELSLSVSLRQLKDLVGKSLSHRLTLGRSCFSLSSGLTRRGRYRSERHLHHLFQPIHPSPDL